MNKEVENIKKKILPILKKHHVAKAGIFGSYARKEQKKRSDVDILIELDEDLSLFGFIDFKNALEKVIKKKIDLVEYDLIRKEIRNQVLKDEIPLIR